MVHVSSAKSSKNLKLILIKFDDLDYSEVVGLCRIVPQGQQEDFRTMMPVEFIQWRASIGCFRVSLQKSSQHRKIVTPFQFFSR